MGDGRGVGSSSVSGGVEREVKRGKSVPDVSRIVCSISFLFPFFLVDTRMREFLGRKTRVARGHPQGTGKQTWKWKRGLWW